MHKKGESYGKLCLFLGTKLPYPRDHQFICTVPVNKGGVDPSQLPCHSGALQLWLLILAIAWFPSLVAYLMYSHALKNVESAKGSTLGILEPLSAVLFSVAILGEAFEPLQIVGITLALIGVALLFYKHT